MLVSDPQLGCGISAEEIRSALSKILASHIFKSAQGQSKFLAYVVTQSIAGRVGREALGRGDSFDPQARKLRLRLAKYYQTEGAHDQILIEFPRGSYVPVYQRAETSVLKAKSTSFLQTSASIVIPICVVSAGLAVAIYRLLN
jgi:hypothetical protein